VNEIMSLKMRGTGDFIENCTEPNPTVPAKNNQCTHLQSPSTAVRCRTVLKMMSLVVNGEINEKKGN